MAQTTTKAKSVLTLPESSNLQTIRNGTGIVLPKPILDYFGIASPEFYRVQIYLLEHVHQLGVYLNFKKKEAFA